MNSTRNLRRAAAHRSGAMPFLDRRRLRLVAQNALEDAAIDARDDTVTQETVTKAQRAVDLLRRLSNPPRLSKRPWRRRSHHFTPRAEKEAARD